MNFTTPGLPRDLTIAAAAKSVHGSRCEANEDCFRVDAHRGVFAIADGLGGHRGGSQASRLATAGLMREGRSLLARRGESEMSVPDLMAQAFFHVHESILGVSEKLPRFRGMGASAAMAIVADGRLYVAGVGDCRAYLIRGEQTKRLTVDQTLFQLLVDAGFTHDTHQNAGSRRLLWSCLGAPKLESPRVRCEPIQDADRVILVTNGVTRVLKDDLIGRLGSAEYAAEIAANLVKAAQQCKTTDDATCLAISFAGQSTESL